MQDADLRLQLEHLSLCTEHHINHKYVPNSKTLFETLGESLKAQGWEGVWDAVPPLDVGNRLDGNYGKFYATVCYHHNDLMVSVTGAQRDRSVSLEINEFADYLTWLRRSCGHSLILQGLSLSLHGDKRPDFKRLLCKGWHWRDNGWSSIACMRKKRGRIEVSFRHEDFSSVDKPSTAVGLSNAARIPEQERHWYGPTSPELLYYRGPDAARVEDIIDCLQWLDGEVLTHNEEVSWLTPGVGRIEYVYLRLRELRERLEGRLPRAKEERGTTGIPWQPRF